MKHGNHVHPQSADLLATDPSYADHRRRPGPGRMAQVAVTVSAMVAATVVAPVAVSVTSATAAAAAGPAVNLVVVDGDAFGGGGGLIDLNAANGTTTSLWHSSFRGNPYGVATNQDGYLLVAERDAFEDTGGLIRVNPSTGASTVLTAERYLSNPTGVAVAPDGAIYVVDADARATLDGPSGVAGVIKVDPATGAQTLVSSGGLFGNPTGIAVEPTAGGGYDLLVADQSAFGGDGGVIRINPSTGTQAEVASNGDFGNPTGIVVAPAGDVYVVDQDWDNGDGGVIKLPAGSIQPGDAVVHPQISTNEVTYNDSWGNPTGIALGSDGNLYVADPDKASSSADSGGVFKVDLSKTSNNVSLVSQTDQLFVSPVGLVAATPFTAPTPTGPYAPYTVGHDASACYTVPAGVTRLSFDVTGEPGQKGYGGRGGAGGFGARVIGVLQVVPGEKVAVNAGDNNTGADGGSVSAGTGGDMSYLSDGCGSGAMLVAAGGGGGGGGDGESTGSGPTYGGGRGGDGGTPNATNGRAGNSISTQTPGYGGFGGTTDAVGQEATNTGSDNTPAEPGSGNSGGSGAVGNSTGFGGGGGGGYFGGGGGAAGEAGGTPNPTSAGGGGGGGGASYLNTADGASGHYYLAPSRLSPASITLTPISITTALTVSATPAAALQGQSVVLTATVSPKPAYSPLPMSDPGYVAFSSGGTSLGTASVDPSTGAATLSVTFGSAGTKQITAEYMNLGGSSFLDSGVTATTGVTVTGHPPAWQSPTPAAGTIVDATPGTPATITVKASDPDSGDTVTLSPISPPQGASWSTSGSNPTTGTLTFTPSAAGQVTIGFSAYDGSGLHAADRSVTVDATQDSPAIVWNTPAAITYGTALDATQLDAALSTAQGALTPPHPGTFTYTPAAGTVPHAEDNTLSVTWTPDAADAVAWSSVTATVTLHVNQAPQTLSFSPAISDSTTYSYGDPPFTVTAVSDAGLAVAYSVGSDDACTSTPSGGSTTITITGVGSCTLTVTQPGDADHTAAAPLSHSFTIAKKTPTLTLTPADAVYGTPLGSGQLDAMINPADAADHGAITYSVDGAAIPADGVLPAGSHTLTATYTPDTGSNYNTASTSATFTVGKAAQAITFASPGNATYLDPAVTLSATGGASGNPVTFTADPATVCTATDSNGSTLTLTGAGDCTITAHQAGNVDYLAAPPVSHTITIAKATPTVSWSAPGQISYGTPLGATQLNAAVTPSIAGTFSYTLADGTTDADGAVLHASATPQTLHVTFTPTDAADYTSATGQSEITVVRADQAITWGALPTGKTYGDTPFDVSAVGGGSGNPVTFTAQSGSTCTVSGSTVTITGAGACVLDADQAGNDDYNPAPTSTQSLTMAKQTPAITWATPFDIVYGTALSAAQLNATVTPSGAANSGTLAYTTDAAAGAAAGQVLHAGTHTLTATYTPDSSGAGLDYTGGTATVALTVTQAPQAITGFTLADATYGDGPVTLSASGGGSGNLVTFAVSAGSTCEIGGDGVTLTLTGAGSCTVTAHQAGNADYLDAPDVTQTVTIAKAPQVIDFAQPADAHVADPTITLTATGGGSGNPVTFTVGPLATCSSTAAGILTITGPGTCTVTASQLGNGNYLDAAPVERSFTVSYRICDLTPTRQLGLLFGILQIQVTTCDADGHSLASRSIVVHTTGVDGGPAIPVGFFQRSNNFRYIGWHGGRYVYNLWVGDLAVGSHTMTFTVAGDPTEHSVEFALDDGCLSIWKLL